MRGKKGVIVCVNHVDVKTVKSAASLLASVVVRNKNPSSLVVGALVFNDKQKILF